jgi:hypothetical protein
MRAALAVLLVAATASATPEQRCRVAGTWSGTGDDTAGNHWTFTLELAENTGEVSGVFHWKHPVYAGDEYFRGKVDCAKRTMSLVANRAEGNVGTGSYSIVFAADYGSFIGKWTCGGCEHDGSLVGHR